MTGLVPAAVASSLLACPLLALVPARAGNRAMAAGAIAAAGATALLAVSDLAWPVSAGTPAWWLDDRLSRSLSLLAAMPWLLVSIHGGSTRSRPAGGWRWQVAAQMVTAGAVLACRAAPLFLTLAGMALLLAGMALLHDHYRRQAALFAAFLLTAWLGVAAIGAVLGHPSRWDALGGGMPAAPALSILLLLPMLLLAFIAAAGPDGSAGLVHAAAGDRIARALLPVPVAAPVLGMVLRLRASFLLGGDVLIGIGCLGLLLATGLMPARRGLDQRVSLAAATQLGAALIGLGTGGANGIAASLMILLFLALSLPVALLPAGGPAAGPVRRLAVLAIAGMPPFGPFLAGFVLLPGVFASAPLPGALLLAAFAADALLLLSALRRARPPSGPAGPVAGLFGVLVLALLAFLGLAMPDGLSAWLLDLGEAAAGGRAVP